MPRGIFGVRVVATVGPQRYPNTRACGRQARFGPPLLKALKKVVTVSQMTCGQQALA